VRTTIKLDDHLLADVKAYAAGTGRTLSEVVAEGLRGLLAIAAEVERRGPVRLPVLRGSRFQPGVDLDDSAALLELEEEGHGPL